LFEFFQSQSDNTIHGLITDPRVRPKNDGSHLVVAYESESALSNKRRGRIYEQSRGLMLDCSNPVVHADRQDFVGSRSHPHLAAGTSARSIHAEAMLKRPLESEHHQGQGHLIPAEAVLKTPHSLELTEAQ
jgi:hypothetical protein